MRLKKETAVAVKIIKTLRKYPNGLQVKEIAKIIHEQTPWVAKIAANLVDSGLINSNLGRNGNYFIKNQKKKIKLTSIMKATEDELRIYQTSVRAMKNKSNSFDYELVDTIIQIHQLLDSVLF